jgi:hypothetical protein
VGLVDTPHSFILDAFMCHARMTMNPQVLRRFVIARASSSLRCRFQSCRPALLFRCNTIFFFVTDTRAAQRSMLPTMKGRGAFPVVGWCRNLLDQNQIFQMDQNQIFHCKEDLWASTVCQRQMQSEDYSPKLRPHSEKMCILV